MRRERLCLDPRPANGGKDCVGSGIEHAACEITGCSGESLMLMHLLQVYALIRQSLVTPHLCTCMYSHFYSEIICTRIKQTVMIKALFTRITI